MTRPMTSALLTAVLGACVLAGGFTTAAHAKKNSADVLIEGNDNGTLFKQKGKGNHVVGGIFGDDGTIETAQTGDDNTLGVLTVGKGAKIKHKQTGTGKMAVDVDIGFDE